MYVWTVNLAPCRKSPLATLLYPNLGFACRPASTEFSAQIQSGRVILGKQREDSQPKAWKTVSRWAIVVFLLAVLCIFASFGFVFDGMDMGRQSALCLAFSVVIIALFATSYAVSRIIQY